ncbi:MAG TPA: hypothetical protein VNA04_18125 [Thermoanaerobaculia bacterium]|nr:hypothetical protein [Thermoanaerobaculia bacterium]
MGADRKLFEEFLTFSSVLTGFKTFRLRGTGQAEVYFSTVNDIVGEGMVKELLETFRGVVRGAGDDAAAFERGLRREILSDGKLGPVARHVIKLWYVGIWYELPGEWREAYGENEKDRTFVVSPVSYTEGLLWPAIGANPSGAKPLGYGMWATPPRIEE